jgi:hypothetical protein
MAFNARFFLFISLVLAASVCFPQQEKDTAGYKIVAAGPEYKRPVSYQWWWGHNRRREWITPVRVPILWLDSIYGGLKPYKTGGGNETKSLRLRSTNGKEYALRSINKSRTDVIAKEFGGTFVEEIIKDGVSMSYPYGAFVVPYMEAKAGIYHATPVLVYLPSQSVLDTFSKRFQNDLYLLEQKPEGDWSDADNLGNFKSFSSTDEVVKALLENNHSKSDQIAFVRARLFDMLIADWDRHEDNWEWGKREEKNGTLYVPVPKDRDQAFYTHNGFLIDLMLPATGLGFMQNFDYKFGDPKTLNYEEGNIDRFFTNEMTRADWLSVSLGLQQSLADAVIEKSVRELPPEIFAVSGLELIEKLKARVKDLPAVASTYYDFIAQQVEIMGSRQNELFQVKSLPSGEIAVAVFRITNGEKENLPFYERIFKPGETKELRLYGIDGQDRFQVNANTAAIRIRIIGGPARDSFIQEGKRIDIYDDDENFFETSSARVHTSGDSSIHEYKYNWFNYDSKGFSPVVSYNYEDRIYAGVHYIMKSYKWRREPFASRHRVGLNYSFTQQALSATYDGIYPRVFQKSDVTTHANYDFVRWTNFFGLGNETSLNGKNIKFYRMQSADWLVALGLTREIGKNVIEISPFVQSVDIKKDTTLFVGEIFESAKQDPFEPNHYGGLAVTYKRASVNDSIVPTKGFTVSANAIYVNNFTQENFFQKYDARIQGFVSLTGKWCLLLRVGGSTIVGNRSVLDNPQMYQHAVVGGPESLRGYRYERFWGKTSFYNNNEIRYITKLRSYVLNATVGVFAFFDNGKVWMPDEESNMLHTSYGAGILVAPFNFLSLGLTYGMTPESSLFQFRINTLF